MNWLTNFVRPKIRALVRKPDAPRDLWEKCPECEQMIFRRDLAANQYVCQHCGFHLRLDPKTRLAALFDGGEYQRDELPGVPHDVLKFRDKKRYADRLKEARSRTGESDAVIVAHGRMDGLGVVVSVFDFGFLGGSMGIAVGEAIIAAARHATRHEAPLIVFPASGGARMQEGVLSLMQLARTTIAIDEVKEAGLPYIVVLTNPTTGGVTASFAMLGDITLAEPGALIGFAGPRVIENTLRQSLPEGFQKAEYLLDHGMVDAVVPRREMRATLIRLLDLLTATPPAAEVVDLTEKSVEIPEAAPAEAAAEPAARDEDAGAE